MSILYKTIAELCESRGISGYRLCKNIKIQPSLLTDLKMGRIKSLSAENLSKISNYFGVSMEYLLGKEQKENAPDELSLTDEERRILLALREKPGSVENLAKLLGITDN